MITAETEVEDRLLRKPDYASGYAEYGVRNRADELLKSHYRRVATVLDELFRTSQYELLIVGGHQHEVPGFIGFLPRELRERVAGKFTVDPGTATLGDIRPSTEAIVENYEHDEERRLVAEIAAMVAAGGPAAQHVRADTGLKDHLTAASLRFALPPEPTLLPGHASVGG